MPRIIDRHIQLVTQSSDCCLLTYSDMKTRFERAWDEMEFTRNPEEFLYLQQNGRSFANRSPWIRFYSYPNNIPLYHQRVRLLHIDKRGRIFDDPLFAFNRKGKALFLRFINIKNRKGLDAFIEETKDFCIFPDRREQVELARQYKEAVGEEIHNFLFPMHVSPTREMTEKEAGIAKAIRKVNLDHIWEKKCFLQYLVDSYNKGTLKMRELAILSRHMALVSELFLDEKDFNIRKIRKDMDAEGDGRAVDMRVFDDVIGERTVNDIEIFVPAYRVYGHFALCCLEFFHTIRAEKGLDQCDACGLYYEKVHGNQVFCSERCKKKGSAIRSKKHRDRKKI